LRFEILEKWANLTASIERPKTKMRQAPMTPWPRLCP